MVNKATEKAKPFDNGQKQAGAMLGMQREVLEACDQASRAWLDRVKSEVDLWTELAAKAVGNPFPSGSDWDVSGVRDAPNADGSRRRAQDV